MKAWFPRRGGDREVEGAARVVGLIRGPGRGSASIVASIDVEIQRRCAVRRASLATPGSSTSRASSRSRTSSSPTSATKNPRLTSNSTSPSPASRRSASRTEPREMPNGRRVALAEPRAGRERAGDDQRADLVVGEADDRADAERACAAGLRGAGSGWLTFDVRMFYRARDPDASGCCAPTDTGRVERDEPGRRRATRTTGTLGTKNLTTMHAVAQALAIGPMFSVALILGGVSRPDIGAGWNATLAVLLAGLGVVAIAYTISLYARKYAGAGAVYEYLTHGAHPWVGVFTAGFFFVGALFLGGGGIYLGLGVLSDNFWNAHISDSGPAWWIWGMIALAIVLVLNYFGVRLAIRAMLTFAVISFVPMLILALVIIVKGGENGNTLTMFDPGQTSLFGITGGGVLGGILLGILLFVGFEAAASIGEESEDPHRSIPRALIGTVAVAARSSSSCPTPSRSATGRRPSARAPGRSRRAPSATWRRSTSGTGTRRCSRSSSSSTRWHSRSRSAS